MYRRLLGRNRAKAGNNLSAVLNPKTEQRDKDHDEKESRLARLTAHF